MARYLRRAGPFQRPPPNRLCGDHIWVPAAPSVTNTSECFEGPRVPCGLIIWAPTVRSMTTVSIGMYPYRAQRLTLSSGERTWTVLGADHRMVEPAAEYLEYLRAQLASPNTVKSYARALRCGGSIWMRSACGGTR
jgi:hypothetical protein